MNNKIQLASLLLAPVFLGGAAFATLPVFGQSPLPQTVAATAEIKDGQGATVGAATFRTTQSGEVRVQVKVRDFEAALAGEHGIHVHAVGSCVAPGFTSAGPHFNPGARQHGTLNPAGHHAGDLPNIVLNDDGNATFNYTTDSISFDPTAPNYIFDADGSAIVLHQGRDDLLTDPSGNSGPRIACGVIE